MPARPCNASATSLPALSAEAPLVAALLAELAAEPAGMFGWVETGVDTDMLTQRMLDEGYLIAPGALFHATRQPCTLMRINFANTQDPNFWRAWKRVVAESKNTG